MFEIETIMTTDVTTVTRHTPITRVLEIMSEHNVTGLPVVNDDMTLVGRDICTIAWHDYCLASIPICGKMQKNTRKPRNRHGRGSLGSCL